MLNEDIIKLDGFEKKILKEQCLKNNVPYNPSKEMYTIKELAEVDFFSCLNTFSVSNESSCAWEH